MNVLTFIHRCLIIRTIPFLSPPPRPSAEGVLKVIPEGVAQLAFFNLSNISEGVRGKVAFFLMVLRKNVIFSEGGIMSAL